MAPMAINDIQECSNWGTTWDDFNRLHQRLLTVFHLQLQQNRFEQRQQQQQQF